MSYSGPNCGGLRTVRRGEILARQLRRRDRRQDARLQGSAQLTPGDLRAGSQRLDPGGRCGPIRARCGLRTVRGREIPAGQIDNEKKDLNAKKKL